MPASERILLVWYRPFELGGVETFMLYFAREAIARGAEVAIAATHDAKGPLRAEFERTGVQVLDWSAYASAFAGTGDPPAVKRLLADGFARLQPTLVLLNDCNDFSIGAAPLLAQVRPCATILDTFHIDSPEARYLDFRQHFAGLVDGFVGTNRNILQRFVAHDAAFSSAHCEYIPNGVPPCDEPHDPPGESLSILYVGRLAQDQKRVQLLPALFAQLKASGRAFTATICGDGPEREALQAALRDHGVAGQVAMAGYRTPAQVQQLLLRHDVLVNVSSFEGFSMSLLEALATGCVPTCTDVASMDHDHLVNGGNCLLVPPDEPEQLVPLWRSLTPSSIGALSAAARNSARALSAGACVERYLACAARLRDARPLAPWPHGWPTSRMADWDIARNNPWLARRSGWRRALHSLQRVIAA